MHNIQEITKLSIKEYSQKKIGQFKLKLHEMYWADLLAFEDTKKVYDDFLNTFSTYHNECSPKVETKLKIYLASLDSKRILRSSKITKNF